MSNKIEQMKKIVCNMVVWLMIWLIAVLAIPVGLILLVIYCVRTFSDRVIRKINDSPIQKNAAKSGGCDHGTIKKYL